MQGGWERRPLLRDKLGNKAGAQTLEVIRPMMVPIGARQHARIGCGACWSTQMSETKNSQAEGRPAAPGMEVVHLVFEVCSAGQDGGVAFGALSEQTPAASCEGQDSSTLPSCTSLPGVPDQTQLSPRLTSA